MLQKDNQKKKRKNAKKTVEMQKFLTVMTNSYWVDWKWGSWVTTHQESILELVYQ